MAREPRQGPPAPGGTLELLLLALARPGEALARARAALAKNPGPYDASVARQAIGIVLREFGDMNATGRADAEFAAAESLRDARGDLDDDPVQVATGMSFLALGAG
jgi:hypothetical protein